MTRLHGARSLRIIAAALSIASVATVSLSAQANTPRPSLPARLGADARAVIEHVIDSARSVGLPTAPLTDKVLEGVLKGADDQRIVLAVQSLVRELALARGLLGPASDPSTLGATASALHAGVSSQDLRKLIKTVGDEPARANRLSGALIALVDIVAKRVAPGVAAATIGSLLERGAADAQFNALRNDLDEDILSGRAPEAALRDRARAQLRLMGADPAHPLVPPRVPPMLDTPTP
ncbi:MAG: hypothetical protein ABJE47_22530 [bacterium]